MSTPETTNAGMKDSLLTTTERIYSEIPASPSKSLTKAEIKELLGETLDAFYTNVVQALVDTGNFVRVRGYHGGVKLNPLNDQSSLPEWAEVQDSIKKSFNNISFETPIATTPNEDKEHKEDKKERELYKPLKEYLVRTGLYEIVDVAAKLQGTKWQNADLIGINYLSDSVYHADIEMRVTAFEVKRNFPSIQAIQQTSSYLTFANAAYLCYVDDQFRGNGIDDVVARLRDEGLWDQIEQVGIGVIVIYYPQEKSQNPRFQTIRYVPFARRSLGQIEQGIELWASDDIKSRLRSAVAKQQARALQGVN